jgi:HTH-type transcriptional repressor of NAD biosynthesis genes
MSVPSPDVIRVVVTGAESTGKTELAEWLAAEMEVPWSAEFAREYAGAKGGAGVLAAADVEPIARGQRAAEDAAIAQAAAAGRPFVVHDTDLLSTVVYGTTCYGEAAVSEWLRAAIAGRQPAMYLVCTTDVPWQEDAVRDPGQDRESMQRRFLDALDAQSARWEVLPAERGERRKIALAAVTALLRTG